MEVEGRRPSQENWFCLQQISTFWSMTSQLNGPSVQRVHVRVSVLSNDWWVWWRTSSVLLLRWSVVDVFGDLNKFSVFSFFINVLFIQVLSNTMSSVLLSVRLSKNYYNHQEGAAFVHKYFKFTRIENTALWTTIRKCPTTDFQELNRSNSNNIQTRRDFGLG